MPDPIRTLALAAALVGLTACGAAADGDPTNGDAPPAAGPPTNQVLAVTEDFALPYLPAVAVEEREWDVELDHDVRDVEGVFDHYDAQLTAAGFERTDLEREGDEIEASYAHPDGASVELEVEVDDGRTQVDLDADDLGAATDPEPFTARAFGPFEIEFHEADVVEIEWDFEVDYAGDATSVEEAYAHYHGALTELGWTHTEGETEWDEIEADYFSRDGVELELEVEEDDGRVQVEIELDKDRFYD